MSADGGGAAPPVHEPPPDHPRFQQVVEQRNALRAEKAALEEQLQAAIEKAATVDTLAKQIESMKASHKGVVAGYEERLALSGAGINDSDGQTVVRALYNSLPDAERPKTISDYLGQFQGENAAEPPRALAPYLKAPEPAESPAPAPAPGSPMPRAPKPGGTAPKAGDVTGEALRAARLHAQRTGDFTQYKALRAQMGANLG